MKRLYYLGILLLFLSSCKSGPFNLIKPVSPHKAYERKLINAGLSQTFMGNKWINKAQQSLLNPIPISLPYQERGYFAAEKIEAAVFNFTLQRGQKLILKLAVNPGAAYRIYADLFMQDERSTFKFIASADTLQNILEYAVDKTGPYLLRLQPELLSSGEYTLELTTGPSLKFPVKAGKANQIQSLFGDGRDGNTRKHEGVDIFAPFRTPVIAVANGRVTGVNENELGGKVVWFKPEGKDYTIYYAHLDEQTVNTGQSVKYGDTLGRMGNTGNAKTTPPHLHFGIYTNDGAVDPFPFVNPIQTTAPNILSSTGALNASVRVDSRIKLQNAMLGLIEPGTIMRVNAATENQYRVELPNGKIGYVFEKQLVSTKKPVKSLKLAMHQLDLFDEPDTTASVKLKLKSNKNVAVLGYFGDFQFIENEDKLTGWIKK